LKVPILDGSLEAGENGIENIVGGRKSGIAGAGAETTPPPGPTCETSTETGPPGLLMENCSANERPQINRENPITTQRFNKTIKLNLLQDKQNRNVTQNH